MLEPACQPCRNEVQDGFQCRGWIDGDCADPVTEVVRTAIADHFDANLFQVSNNSGEAKIAISHIDFNSDNGILINNSSEIVS